VEDDYLKETYDDFEKTNLFNFITNTGDEKDKYSFSTWNHPNEMQNFQGSDAKREMNEIMVLGHKVNRENGRQCNPFEMFTVQYKGWIKDGKKGMKKILDSSKLNDGKPITF
jgi:hypothetical protein